MKTSIGSEHFLAVGLVHYIWNMLNVIIEIIETFHTVSCSEFCMLSTYSFPQLRRTLHASYTNVSLRIGNPDIVGFFLGTDVR